MKLGVATCGKIAKAIVGEGTPFPSRSISKLETSLHEHDIDETYRNNDSKHKLACRAVNGIDTCDEESDDLHETLTEIIVALADRDNFSDFREHLNEADQRQGVEYFNVALSFEMFEGANRIEFSKVWT